LYSKYIVKRGDTIESIAKLYNISPAELMNMNNIQNMYYLIPGMELIVPAKGESSMFYTYQIKPGDTLFSIAQNNNISLDLLAQINGLKPDDYIYPNQTILIPKSDTKTYITKTNDTLDSVANYFNVPVSKILTDNKKVFLLPDQLIIYKEK
jgi:LysM repeat protein